MKRIRGLREILRGVKNSIQKNKIEELQAFLEWEDTVFYEIMLEVNSSESLPRRYSFFYFKDDWDTLTEKLPIKKSREQLMEMFIRI